MLEKKLTKSEVLLAARKCKTPTEIYTKYRREYNYIIAYKLQNEAYAHMPKKYFWSDKDLSEEALKYNSLNQFKRKSRTAYGLAIKRNLLKKICTHMDKRHKWKETSVKAEAKKYQTKIEFLKASRSAYRFASNKGILEEVCRHMKRRINIAGYWSKNRVIQESKKYNTRRSFKVGCEVAYNKVLKNNWQNEAFSHMERVGNQELKAVYIYEFSDRSVYIGITGDYERRYQQHHGNIPGQHKTVTSKLKSGLNYKYFEQHEFMRKEEIVEEEAWWIEWYMANGWNILNIARAGGLGGSSTKWTKESCAHDAKNFATRTEWQKKGNKSAYNAAHRAGWLDDVCSHMKKSKITVKRNFWTLDECIKLAQRCVDYADFRLNHRGAYIAVRNNNWRDKIRSIFKPILKSC